MIKLISFMAIFSFVGASTLLASIEEAKLYKEAYGKMPKCSQCHTDAVPKKDAGMHELNDYGKKVIALNAAPTADTYRETGEAS